MASDANDSPIICFLNLDAAVKKKYNSLRISYRREVKNEEASKRSGASASAVYTSNWVHFERMAFIRDSCWADTSTSNFKLAGGETSQDDELMDLREEPEDQNSQPQMQPTDEPAVDQSSQDSDAFEAAAKRQPLGIVPPKSTTSKRRAAADPPAVEQKAAAVGRVLAMLEKPEVAEDPIDSFAKVVAADLKKMDGKPNYSMHYQAIIQCVHASDLAILVTEWTRDDVKLEIMQALIRGKRKMAMAHSHAPTSVSMPPASNSSLASSPGTGFRYEDPDQYLASYLTLGTPRGSR